VFLKGTDKRPENKSKRRIHQFKSPSNSTLHLSRCRVALRQLTVFLPHHVEIRFRHEHRVVNQMEITGSVEILSK